VKGSIVSTIILCNLVPGQNTELRLLEAPLRVYARFLFFKFIIVLQFSKLVSWNIRAHRGGNLFNHFIYSVGSSDGAVCTLEWTFGFFKRRRISSLAELLPFSQEGLLSVELVVVGPTQPFIQWVPGALSLGVKRPGREANHSPPSKCRGRRMCGVIPPLPQYAFMVWCSVTAQGQLHLFTFKCSCINVNDSLCTFV
jgi:hypothetical protein